MRTLIWRTGAYGDILCTTPFVRYIHELGHEIYYVAGERGEEVLKNNPHIKMIVPHDKTVKNENLGDHMQYLMRKYKCEKLTDFNESIECALSQHPRSPNYKLPKQERIARFNKNFYEHAFDHAKSYATESVHPSEFYRPELFFSDDEISEAKSYLKPGFNILVGLSGSGNNKAYPWMMDLCNNIGKTHPDVHIITVGDLKCQILEDIETPDLKNVTYLSGKIPMRTSMALTSMVQLVISPDTGLLHASGCYETPKIALLGHNTHEVISKHFLNVHPIEADQKLAPCAPCLYMVYNMRLQCPLNPVTQSSICMADGIPLQKVYDKFLEVYAKRTNHN